MPRALRIGFTFLSPDKHLISLFMIREVNVQGSCDLFLFGLKEHSSGLALFPPCVAFLHAFTGTGPMCLLFPCSFGHLAGFKIILLSKLLPDMQEGFEAVTEVLMWRRLRATIRALGPDPLLMPLEGQRLPRAPLAPQLTFNHSTVQVPEVTFSTVNC